MSGGIRGGGGRDRGRGGGNDQGGDNVNLPPPPSMVQLMAMYEANRADNIRLLERIDQNTARRQDD
jgi:hypothetical protein